MFLLRGRDLTWPRSRLFLPRSRLGGMARLSYEHILFFYAFLKTGEISPRRVSPRLTGTAHLHMNRPLNTSSLLWWTGYFKGRKFCGQKVCDTENSRKISITNSFKISWIFPINLCQRWKYFEKFLFSREKTFANFEFTFLHVKKCREKRTKIAKLAKVSARETFCFLLLTYPGKR